MIEAIPKFCLKCEIEAKGDENVKKAVLSQLKHECGKEEVSVDDINKATASEKCDHPDYPWAFCRVCDKKIYE